jgi:hypothetical protein
MNLEKVFVLSQKKKKEKLIFLVMEQNELLSSCPTAGQVIA